MYDVQALLPQVQLHLTDAPAQERKAPSAAAVLAGGPVQSLIRVRGARGDEERCTHLVVGSRALGELPVNGQRTRDQMSESTIASVWQGIGRQASVQASTCGR